MTTLTARRRTTFRRPGTPLLVVTMLAVAVVLLLAALTIPRLMSTPSVTQPAHTISYPGGGGNESHQVRENGSVRNEQVPPFTTTQTQVTYGSGATADRFWHEHGPMD